MVFSHMDVLTEILYDAELFDEIDEILSREGTVMEGEKFVRLDLSKLGITELPEIINALRGIKILDLRNNNLRDFPKEMLDLEETNVLLGGNPVDSFDLVKNNIKVKTREKQRLSTGEEKYVSKIGKVYFPEKACSWCGKSNGYTREAGKLEGTWGSTKHYVEMLICTNCGYIFHFYESRFLF